MRRRTLILVAGTGLLVLTYATSLAFVWHAAREDQARPVGAIVVLGAAQYNGRPSPVLKARLDRALALERQGIAPLMVVTGAAASGDRESEAAVERRYLVARGVADSMVVSLAKGTNTEETIAAVAAWVRERGIPDVLLVSDGFHLARLRIEARRNGLAAYTSPSTGSPIVGSREWGYFLVEGAKLPVAWVR